MGLAGSEVVVVWALQALKGHFELHLCTAAGFNPEKWNAVAGTSLQASDIKFIQAPHLPLVRSGDTLPYWHRGMFEEFCRSIAGNYDLCVSGYNPLRFGRPALHIIGDISWYQRLTKEPAVWTSRRILTRVWKLCHWAYQAAVNHLYFKKDGPGFTDADWFLSNSLWSMRHHKAVSPQVQHKLLYPPVPVEGNGPLPVKPKGIRRRFVSLGRVSPAKRIIEKIHMMEKVRALGHDIDFIIIGKVGDDAYGTTLKRMAGTRAGWLTLAGARYGEDKNAILREAEFGLHACADEAFGIAVAELVSHGCLTWVPAGSGSAEIVPDERFHYRTDDDAVQSIDTLLRAETSELTDLRTLCRDHVLKNFLPGIFVQRFRENVAEFRREQGV